MAGVCFRSSLSALSQPQCAVHSCCVRVQLVRNIDSCLEEYRTKSPHPYLQPLCQLSVHELSCLSAVLSAHMHIAAFDFCGATISLTQCRGYVLPPPALCSSCFAEKLLRCGSGCRLLAEWRACLSSASASCKALPGPSIRSRLQHAHLAWVTDPLSSSLPLESRCALLIVAVMALECHRRPCVHNRFPVRALRVLCRSVPQTNPDSRPKKSSSSVWSFLGLGKEEVRS